MAYDALSSEQQELLDLLRNELADYVDAEPPQLWESVQTWQTHFDYLTGQLEHLIRAVQMVGLTGFAASCEFLLQQFHAFANLQSRPGKAAEAHIGRWPVAFLGYLQQILAKGFTPDAALQLVDYLAFDEWPEPLDIEKRDSLLQSFEGSDVIVDDQPSSLYPDQITDEQASLAIPDDVRPELLDGLTTELPNQAESFSASIEHYIHTNDASYLLTAQRVAHTVKGAANVVGIVGMANLMHYCEDLLETHQKGIDVGGDGFADLLLDAADCLANISDSLQGFAPAPDNVQVLLVQLLRALHGEAAYANPEVLQEPPVLEHIHSGEESGLQSQLQADPSPNHFEYKNGAASDSAEQYPLIEEVELIPEDLFSAGNDFSEIDALLAGDDFTAAPLLSEVHGGGPQNNQKNLKAETDNLNDQALAVESAEVADSGVLINEAFSSDDPIELDELSGFEELGADDLFGDDLSGIEELESLELDSKALPASLSEVSADSESGAEPQADKGQAAKADEINHADLMLSPENSPQDIDAQEGALNLPPKVEEVERIAPPIAAQVVPAATDDVKPQFNLTIPDEKATELLRITGEMQIANTQMIARTDTAHEVLKAALRFQSQLIELADDFDKQLAKESAARIAAGREGEVDMDPLELERYNELHSFASRLQEVVTDAQEAVRDADSTMLDLKAIAEDQRQMGFDMQNQVLGVRMLPAGVMASRFARAVRQASRLTGKPAKFSFEGEDVLVDSRVLHGIADPILHLLRNAVDHGLESSSADRLDANKTSEGCVRVSFERVGESVRIQVGDDGRGLDYKRIAELSVERGLLKDGHDYQPAELQQIILLPGFSTRDQVTQTSGRGIGLDVVSDQVRQLKGQLQINSDAGNGTQFVMSVPMSVMSAHLLLVRSGGRMVGVISRGLQQIVYLQAGDLYRNDDGQWQYAQGEKALDVYAFDDITQVAGGCNADECAALLITQKADGSQCAIALEAIRASEEHVVKPLSRWAYRAEGVTGAAILGNGEVVAVVDVHDLPALRYSSQQFEQWMSQHANQQAAFAVVAKPIALVVDDSLSARRALAQFMSDAGYEVVSARDGFEAIKLLESDIPEIALIDLEMPRMNGLELAAHMRSQSRLKEVPVVMITSRTTARHKILAENAGVDRYMNKPWSDDELTETLVAMANKGSKSAVG